MSISQFMGTLIVASVYVGIGLWAWYRNRPKVFTIAPGQFFGDFWYHGILSLAAVALVIPTGTANNTPDLLLLRWGVFLACCGLWWILEVNNYGPMRAP